MCSCMTQACHYKGTRVCHLVLRQWYADMYYFHLRVTCLHRNWHYNHKQFHIHALVALCCSFLPFTGCNFMSFTWISTLSLNKVHLAHAYDSRLHKRRTRVKMLSKLNVQINMVESLTARKGHFTLKQCMLNLSAFQVQEITFNKHHHTICW